MSLKEQIMEFIVKYNADIAYISLLLLVLTGASIGVFIRTGRILFVILALVLGLLCIIIFKISEKGEKIENQRFMDKLFGPNSETTDTEKEHADTTNGTSD